MNLIILFFALFISCNSVQENKSREQNTQASKSDTSTKELTKSEVQNFVADTTVSNKFLLENYQSFEKVNLDKLELIERIRSSPVAVFSNKNNREYLLAYQYEGDTKNSFGCFEIGNLSELKNVTAGEITMTEFDEFKTESGLQLGQSIEEVKKIKGNSYQEKIDEGEVTFIYKIDDTEKFNFLKRYNMPGYFMKVTFSPSNKVNEILFGFDYP